MKVSLKLKLLMIGCTGLLAEPGIPRTRAGRHRQRTRHAASGRGGPSTATTPSTTSTASATGARPLMRPGRCLLAGRVTLPAGGRRPEVGPPRRRDALPCCPAGQVTVVFLITAAADGHGFHHQLQQVNSPVAPAR